MLWLLFLVTIPFSSAQLGSIGCFVPGECLASPVLAINFTDAVDQCLQMCQVYDFLALLRVRSLKHSFINRKWTAVPSSLTSLRAAAALRMRLAFGSMTLAAMTAFQGTRSALHTSVQCQGCVWEQSK